MTQFINPDTLLSPRGSFQRRERNFEWREEITGDMRLYDADTGDCLIALTREYLRDDPSARARAENRFRYAVVEPDPVNIDPPYTRELPEAPDDAMAAYEEGTSTALRAMQIIDDPNNPITDIQEALAFAMVEVAPQYCKRNKIETGVKKDGRFKKRKRQVDV